MVKKLTSRKFWLSAAALLGSIGAAFAGLATDNQLVATVGLSCAVASSAIYSLIEGFVDATALGDGA